MKKAMAVCVVLLMLSAVAMSAPTTVTLVWNAYGGPGIDFSFYNGDDSFAKLLTSGNHFLGTFHGQDGDDNSYNYGVDSGLFQLKANVESGGYIQYEVDRTDTKASMYGPAGQISYSAVGSSDGTASIALQTTTNFAEQQSCNYGFQANNQFQGAGTSFSVYHYIGNGDGDWASVQVVGSGSASVTYMNQYMGGTSFRFGHGCGCYNNCGATGTGSGTFELKASGANYLTGNGWTAPAGGSYLQQVIYNGGFTVTDPFVDGN